MSAPAKTSLTKIELRLDGATVRHTQIQVSKAEAAKVVSAVRQIVSNLRLVPSEKGSSELLTVEQVWPEMKDPVKRGASVLRGFRYRDGLTQAELAKKAKLRQAEVSAMENGKRAIGKEVAKRLALVFKTDYRVFL